MATNHKAKGTAISMPLGLILGLAISMIITLMLASLISYLVLSEKMTENAIGYGAMLTVLLSSALGALIAVARIKRRRLITCVASGACYYLMLLSITALFFGGQYQGMGVTALLIFSGTGCIALLGLKGERHHAAQRKKHYYR